MLHITAQNKDVYLGYDFPLSGVINKGGKDSAALSP